MLRVDAIEILAEMVHLLSISDHAIKQLVRMPVRWFTAEHRISIALRGSSAKPAPRNWIDDKRGTFAVRAPDACL
jgi:ethanolamine utilization cobalamin adenosyltransferase